MKLEWNVYYYSINENEIKRFNVFDHCGFYNNLIKIKKKYCKYNKVVNEPEFRRELLNTIFGCFCGKSEYEIIVSPLLGPKDKSLKIDIYDQIMLNFDKFYQYIADNLAEIKEVK
jgi:hypothetical protein